MVEPMDGNPPEGGEDPQAESGPMVPDRPGSTVELNSMKTSTYWELPKSRESGDEGTLGHTYEGWSQSAVGASTSMSAVGETKREGNGNTAVLSLVLYIIAKCSVWRVSRDADAIGVVRCASQPVMTKLEPMHSKAAGEATEK